MSGTADLRDTAKEHASDLAQQAKAAATQQAVAQAENAKQMAAGKVTQAADAAEAAASELDPASPQAQAMQQVADTIEDAAAKLRSADIRQVADQVTDMARRNPLLFIGGAAIAGFAAARFLKARDPQPTAQMASADPWGGFANDADDDGHTSTLAKINGGPNG